MLLFAVTEDIEHSVELVKLPELLRQEDLTILLVRELSPDLWHEHPDTDSEFLTLVVKTDTSSNNLLSPQGTLFPERDSKWTSPGLKQNLNVAGGSLQCLWTGEFLPLFDP